MRCIVVNGAQLKAEVVCAHCGKKIADRYVREFGSRLVYCDYRCYKVAAKPSVVTKLESRSATFSAWTVGS
jgi:hypothetical protein